MKGALIQRSVAARLHELPLVALFAIGVATPALAQEAATDPAAPVQADIRPDTNDGLADIVVTARKRNERSQDAPVAITALGPEQIARYDLSSLEKIASATPQLTIGRATSGSGAQITLRGIGSSSSSIGIEQSVAVVVDSVYFGQGRVINEGFFDLGQIEILKGPQALFFGKNATAGVISISSAKPTDKAEYSARIGYEIASEELSAELIASGPITDTLRGRLALRGTRMFGGYYRNLAQPSVYRTTDVVTGIVTPHAADAAERKTPGGKSFIARGTLVWDATPGLTATLTANVNFDHSENPSWNYVLYNCPYGVAQLNASEICRPGFRNYLSDFPADLRELQPYGKSDGRLFNDYSSYNLTANIDYAVTDKVNLTVVANYNRNSNTQAFDGDAQVALTGGTFSSEHATYRAFSTEARLLTDFDFPLNVLVGGYFQDTNRNYQQFVTSAGLENSAAPEPFQRYLMNQKDSQTDGRTFAAFGQAILALSDQIEVTGGVRYTHETKDSYFIQPYSHPTRVAQGIFVPGKLILANQVFDNWSPEVTARYKPSQAVTLYAAYKTGYKSGGFSNSGNLSTKTVVDNFAFQPETARGFEGGVKSNLLDRQLRLDVTAYHYTFNDLQVDFFNSPTFAYITTNAGSAKTDGIELEMELSPRAWHGFSLRGSVNYNHARYGSYIAPCYSGQTPAMGCTIVGPAPQLTPQQDLSGMPTSIAPRWTGSLGATYSGDLSDDLKWELSADGRYSGEYFASGFGNPRTIQSAYVSLDATARITTSGGWQFAVIGRNLTNKFYLTGGIDAPSTGSGTGSTAGRLADQLGFGNMPRTVQLQVTKKF